MGAAKPQNSVPPDHMKALVYDNYPIIAGCIKSILLSHGIDSVCMASTPSELEEAMKGVDIAVIEMWNKKEVVGPSLAQRIRSQNPRAKICFISDSDDEFYCAEACRRGYNGWILRSWSEVDIKAAIGGILRGKVQFPKSMKDQIATERSNPLSVREREVMRTISSGITEVDSIARVLCIAPPTVRSHIRSMVEKLHLPHKNNLMQVAVAERAFL